MNEAEATAAAEAHARRHLPELGTRPWRATRFAGGWLANPTGDDLARRTGVPCLVVLDDGTIETESSSLPPSLLMAKYGRRPDAPAEDDGG
ncbi:MAG: hypothetical protein OEV40_21920 [Acidimicrobiia bacterium]|nr:hypothetical protein [Acidimicrobiia bacterium]